jgi:hypothetical protein
MSKDMNSYLLEKITCPCGTELCRGSLCYHRKSAKHVNFLMKNQKKKKKINKEWEEMKNIPLPTDLDELHDYHQRRAELRKQRQFYK